MERYPGGKNGAGVYQTIINQIPPHEVYIEPFLGSGAVFRRLRPARVSIGLDMDPTVSVSSARPVMPQTLLSLPEGRWISPSCALAFLEDVANLLDNRRAFIYLDPPYLFSTRKSKDPIYRFEFGTEHQHTRLLEIITALRANIAISGYRSALYDEKLRDWRRVDFHAATRQGLATESLWCNYPEPKELHDYRYLGTDRTDRQRIKRKKERFLGKLKRLPCQERYAILAAVEEWREAL